MQEAFWLCIATVSSQLKWEGRQKVGEARRPAGILKSLIVGEEPVAICQH